MKKRKKLILFTVTAFIIMFSSILSFLPLQKEKIVSFFRENLIFLTHSDEKIYQQAIRFFSEKKYEESLEETNKLIKLYPHSVLFDDATFLMCKIYNHTNEIDKAVSCLEGVLENYTSNETKLSVPNVIYETAIAYFNGKKFDKAEQYLDRLIEEYPEASTSTLSSAQFLKYEITPYKLYEEADVFFKEENFQEAFEIFKNIAINYPVSALALESDFLAAYCQEKMGDKEEALLMYQKILDNYSERFGFLHLETYLQMAEIYFEQRDYDRATEYCEKILENQEAAAMKKNLIERANILMEKIRSFYKKMEAAKQLYIQGEYQEALEKFEEIYGEIANNDFGTEKIKNCLMHIGLCQHHLGKIDEAILTYQKLLNDFPDKTSYNYEAYFKMAEIYFERKDYDKAIEYCEKIIENPTIALSSTVEKAKKMKNYLENL
jgi:tetratricopeptide (TPR) repeat protein